MGAAARAKEAMPRLALHYVEALKRLWPGCNGKRHARAKESPHLGTARPFFHMLSACRTPHLPGAAAAARGLRRKPRQEQPVSRPMRESLAHARKEMGVCKENSVYARDGKACIMGTRMRHAEIL